MSEKSQRNRPRDDVERSFPEQITRRLLRDLGFFESGDNYSTVTLHDGIGITFEFVGDGVLDAWIGPWELPASMVPRTHGSLFVLMREMGIPYAPKSEKRQAYQIKGVVPRPLTARTTGVSRERN